MRRMIEAVAADVTLKEHRENIRVLKQVKKEAEAEMTLAIEQGICPRCNGKLVINGFDYRCPKCGYRFKL